MFLIVLHEYLPVACNVVQSVRNRKAYPADSILSANY